MKGKPCTNKAQEEQELQKFRAERFEKNLDKFVKALKQFNEWKPGYSEELRKALETQGVDMALYESKPKEAIRNVLSLQDLQEDSGVSLDIIQSFLSRIENNLNVLLLQRKSEIDLRTTLNIVRTVRALYHRQTSTKDPQWVQDIDINKIDISEVLKEYEHMEDMKYIKSYCFFSVTVLGTLGADYLVYKLKEISPMAKAASIVISNAFIINLLSYVTEYAQYKWAPLEEKLRKCQHLFKDDYTCPQK